jgi:poly(hydroxyalkanoate) depolymerase family esterase
MNLTFQNLMRSATRLTRMGQLSAATAAIQRALGASRAAYVPPAPPAPPTRAHDPFIDAVDAVDVVDVANEPARSDTVLEHPHAPEVKRGEFMHGSQTDRGLTREYKLYVPPGRRDRVLPLVVMLHGCTQDPDDFAAGTGMNAAADEQGFFVLYPAQAQAANPSRCWNWFKHNHQGRDRGETALIAAMTQAVIRTHRVDADRVYIAGLSAGGAMATQVAAAWPELFAAVGVHSGLPPGAARTLPQALAAMHGGANFGGLEEAGTAHSASSANSGALPVPVIVFHGDRDSTVHPQNGEHIVAAAVAGSPWVGASAPLVEQGVSAGGRRYTRSIYGAGGGPAMAEHWVLHGAGHAWAGGQPAGSYTDPQGPDATREMLRFFSGHRQPRGH